MQQEGYLIGHIHKLICAAAEKHQARLVRNVLLQVDDRFSQYDYILIDRFGPLVIDLEAWPGCVIQGASGAPTWRATAADGRSDWFSNPLAANRPRVADLQQALLVCGRRLAPEYFSDLVLFAGADLDQALLLTAADRTKVLDAAAFAEALQARSDFAHNPGLLERHEIDDLVSLLRTLDRTDSLGNAAAVADKKVGFLASLFGRRRTTRVGMSDSVVGIAPTAPRLTGDRYPEVSGARRIGRVWWAFALVIALSLACGLATFGSVSGIVGWANSVADRSRAMPAAPVYSQPQVSPTLLQAKRAFQSAAPREYAATINLNTPAVSPDQRTYTWRYIPRTGDYRGFEQQITITIDEHGRLVGVTGTGNAGWEEPNQGSQPVGY